MSKLFKNRSAFFKYVMVLVSGTMMAQVMSYAFAPIVTRIYTPEQAAELGMFTHIISLGAAFATLRYELALPIPKNDSHSFRLYRIALRTTVWISVISLVIVAVASIFATNIDRLIFLLMIPFGIVVLAFYSVGTNWALRFKQFRLISYTRVANAGLNGAFKVLFGVFGFGFIGLILGTILGSAISLFWFLRDFGRSRKFYGIRGDSPRNFVLAREYIDFPKVNLPHILMDLGRDLLIAVLIFELFSKEDFGLYDHSFRMLRVPLVLLGTAIGQVFFQRAAEMVNRGEDIIPTMKKALIALILLSLVPFTIVFFFGEEMFTFVFGEEWRASGTYAEILTPRFLFVFISSPLTTLPMILRRQKQFFHIAIFGSILIVAAISLPKLLFGANIDETLWILSISQAIYLVFVIFKIFDFARKAKKEQEQS